MKSNTKSRSERKRETIMEAATRVFLDKGYDGTSMEDVTTAAMVSKPTVYKHFASKERLYSEIVRTTTDQVDALVHLVTESLTDTPDLERELFKLGGQFTAALMQPQMLRLRRLVIANADRFPQVARTWYEQGFERVLTTLASCFQRLAERELLQLDDPVLAAHHFVGLLLWIPVNKAMFSADHQASGKTSRERYVRAAVHAFLNGYGRYTLPPSSTPAHKKRTKGQQPDL